MSRGKAAAGGGIGLVVIAVIVFLMGGDPRMLLQGGGPGRGPQQVNNNRPPSPEEEKLKEFVLVVLADTEDVWSAQLPAQTGVAYKKPKLIFFTEFVESACGTANSAVGPFYCPGDDQIYIDLSFFRQLKERLGAEGDFAVAYVVAHEVGHHVQNLLKRRGLMPTARQLGMEKNEYSVRQELQADFYAGLFAKHLQKTKMVLEVGDIQEAMNAARAVGDDRLQRQSRGYVRPETFTHGTSQQRARWFMKGFDSNSRVSDGDTFKIPYDRL